MTDDHQAMAMGCVGNPDIQTPNLDRLAAEGMRFDRCYAASPLCMPSRATVFTGLQEYRHGVNFKPNSGSVTASMQAEIWDRYSYAPLLREAGYRVGFAGKWGFPLDKPDYSSEFDAWGGFEGHGQGSYDTEKNPSLARLADSHGHVTRALGAFGCEFISSSSTDDRPFCLAVHFKAPHTPHDNIDPADRGLYRDRSFHRRPNWGPEAAARLPSQVRLGRQYYLFSEWDDEHYDAHLRAYYQLISGVDHVVGVLRDQLKQCGLSENTVIIYTSDNGYYCGSHGLGGKILPHEESSRIPLIIHDPRIEQERMGRTSRAVVATIDLAPTILELAGLAPVEDADGESLLPLLHGGAQRIRDSLALIANWGWAENDHTRSMAVVTEEAKYTYWCYGDEHFEPAEELYDLRRDGYELHNRAASTVGSHAGSEDDSDADSKSLLQRMRSLYDEHHRQWSAHCVDSDDYTRHRVLLDRHIRWQEKNYRGFAFPERARDELSRLYKQELKRKKELRDSK